jgi:hypothetical protein
MNVHLFARQLSSGVFLLPKVFPIFFSIWFLMTPPDGATSFFAKALATKENIARFFRDKI